MVTVPAPRWREWLDEGDLPGDPPSGRRYAFYVGARGMVNVEPGDRVYVVALGRVRGFAPLLYAYYTAGGLALIRGGGAEAVTIEQRVPGFRGFRYRWWDREAERPFPSWRE